MSEANPNNRIVWVDVPVSDLERARAFYAAVLGIEVALEGPPEARFGVLEHSDGNGGCLVTDPDGIAGEKGPLLYFGVDGRLRAAVAAARASGGRLLQEVHAIGPHGFRAVLLDSEGNRIALHAEADA